MRAIITLDDNDAGGVDVHTAFEPAGLSNRSNAHVLAQRVIAAAARLATPDRDQLEGAVVHQVTAAQISRTLGQPIADDAHVAVGSTRFSDGQIQTPESQERARERVTIGADDVGTMPPGIVG